MRSFAANMKIAFVVMGHQVDCNKDLQLHYFRSDRPIQRERENGGVQPSARLFRVLPLRDTASQKYQYISFVEVQRRTKILDQ